jgi:hypothetical protein
MDLLTSVGVKVEGGPNERANKNKNEKEKENSAQGHILSI